MTRPNFSELTLFAIDIAKRAGTLLRKGLGSHFQISAKEGKQNLVTEYDKASEEMIVSAIAHHFPDHSVLAEEGGERKNANSEVTWIIDPLDGTVNFAHGIPVFSVSIAAAVNGAIVAGVVYQPMTEELFAAEKGKGTYLGDTPLFVSKIADVESSLMSTGFPYDVDKNPLHCVDKFAKIQLMGVPIRRLGSAALDLSYVAAGRFDAFWEVGLQPWDMAAGKLLVEEAGGKTSHWDGRSHEIFTYSTMLATNGHLHAAMIEHLK